MADILRKYSTSEITTQDIGQHIDDMLRADKTGRKTFERRWYDNNFFDDGHHFRYLSRTQNKIVDLSDKQTIYSPLRAIPKASRQIRGVANLLLSNDPMPVIYPEKVGKINFTDEREYEAARKEAKDVAKKAGHWVEEEFKNQDLSLKLALMVILAAKHGISYLQVWPDPIEEDIRTQVYDAFDIYLVGELTDIYDSPHMIKAVPKFIAQIKADERFDQAQVEKINPDNKQASSEIKEAYMTARFGTEGPPEKTARIILKEAFLKEYVNKDNRARIRKQKNGGDILEDRKDGDPVIRHVFVAGNIWLRDEYTNLPDYPFVDFRLEPGPIYQVPLIERFIPTNKSVDMLVSRIERYTHTMVAGSWLKRAGEQFNISNAAGGQVIEYAGTPPVQANIAPIPAFVFNFMEILNSFIEEQGVTTTTLGKIPKGVKAHAAIESLKESEFANLVIAQRRLKNTVKRIAEKMLDIADSHFISPKTVYYLERGEPDYFDIIGNTALEKRTELNVVEGLDGVVPIKKDYRVEIEVQSGLGYTKEGQKATMLQLVELMLKYAEQGYLNPESVKVVIQRFLETYQFGSVAEFMEALEKGGISDPTIQKIKIGLMEVFKDLQQAGAMPTAEQRIQETKVGVAETAKDLQKGAK